MSTLIKNTRLTLEMIKIEHTLFALPFAFLGALLAANGLPALWQVLWIVVAMVGARSTAMAFNRLADRNIDARNPRTASRALPAGLLSAGFVWAFTIVSAALFLFAAAMLNRLTLDSGAGRARQRVALFAYQALYAVFALRSWLVPLDRADRRVDRRARRDRQPGAAVAVARGPALDCRFRHSLRLPGLRLRSPRSDCARFPRVSASRARSGSRAHYTPRLF